MVELPIELKECERCLEDALMRCEGPEDMWRAIREVEQRVAAVEDVESKNWGTILLARYRFTTATAFPAECDVGEALRGYLDALPVAALYERAHAVLAACGVSPALRSTWLPPLIAELEARDTGARPWHAMVADARRMFAAAG